MNSARLAKWRIAAGTAVLLTLLAVAVRLLPAYMRNLEFQRALDQTVQMAASSSMPDDAVRTEVVKRAAGLGLPVQPGDIRVKRSSGRIEVEVLYLVPVGLPLYVVDLHFRPRASVR
jgi:hypothetical protein